LTFTDQMGRLILKREKLGSTNFDTYYIYNNAGMLSYIVSPKALALMVARSNYSLTQGGVNKMIFHFVYDGRGRLVQKTVPAKGVMYYIYDPLNRPVLVQDSNMRVKNQWNYIKYDIKNRLISQGIYTDVNNTSLSAMQAYVTANDTGVWYESRSATLTNGGYYTNAVFPKGTVTGTSTSALAYAYYDDYKMKETGSPNFAYIAQNDVSLPGEETATTAALRGVPTIVSKTTVGAGLSSPWLTSVTFYDKNLRPIQVQSNNQLNYTNATTVTDTKTMVTDFMGVPLYSKVTKKRTSTDTISVYTKIIYDHVYRIDTIKQKYNSGSFNPVAAYAYNELGQVIKKGLGYVSPTAWLQNLDMRYNIRGQLLYINNSQLKNDTGKTNSDTTDVFGMHMFYDQVDANLGNTAYFNGKLSAVTWMSRNGTGVKTNERSFKYSYDALNRYTGVSYAAAATGNSFNYNVDGFDENSITYDGGGNILTLKRNAANQAGTSHHQIDSLVYTYSGSTPYQLTKVTDGTDTLHTDAGFR